MEDQQADTRSREIVFTGACLAVASLVLFLPFHHLHSQEDHSSMTVESEHHQELPGTQHNEQQQSVYEKKHFLIDGRHYSLEIADTEEKRALGLGHREALCEDCGMLFVFDQPGRPGFWMKHMRFSLDILWIRNGKIVYKQSNISPHAIETFVPSVEADSVIEILPNDAIQVGDRVSTHNHDE